VYSGIHRNDVKTNADIPYRVSAWMNPWGIGPAIIRPLKLPLGQSFPGRQASNVKECRTPPVLGVFS
jgi:hypothetical protein